MEKDEGHRERKKREILQRIAETGLKLFIDKAYEGTTLEAIAAAAGIARRTFFYCFKSKDEILMATMGGGMVEAHRPALLEQSKDQAPLDAVRNSLLLLTTTPRGKRIDHRGWLVEIDRGAACPQAGGLRGDGVNRIRHSV
ncbi:MAG TPA: TetR/AcrR family transcriptional regulator [Terriglobales bacterium]|nr:TetR/AcrR family transcriptional regulator [Terriglobales bacterium]